MRKTGRAFARFLITAAIVAAAWTAPAAAQSVGPSGCVALCGDGGASSGGGWRSNTAPRRIQTPPSHIANNRGVQLADEGRLLEAIDAYLEALRLDAGNHVARQNLINTYKNLASRYLDQGDLHAAEQAYRNALRYDANDAGALNGLGIVHHRRDDNQAALDYYRRALAADPSAHYARDNLNSLETYLRRVEENRRRNAELDRFYELRRRGYETRGQEAVELLLEAVRLKPDDDMAWFLLALNQRAAGHFADAEASFREAARLGFDIDLDEALRETRFRRDTRRAEDFRDENRIDAYRAMIAVYPERESEIRYKIAAIHLEAGRYRDRVSELLRVLAKPDTPANNTAEAHNSLIYEARNAEYQNDSEAERIYRGFIAVGRGSSAVAYRLARAVQRQGRQVEAFDLLRRAIADHPNSQFLHHNFALILEEAGEYEEAERMARRAAELDPDDEDSRRVLTRLEDHNTSIFRHLDGFRSAFDGFNQAISNLGDTAPAQATGEMLEKAVDKIDDWVGALEEKFGGDSGEQTALAPTKSSLPDDIKKAIKGYRESMRTFGIDPDKSASGKPATEKAPTRSPIKRESVRRPATVVPEPDALAGSYRSTVSRQWPELPEPVVRLSKKGIVYARETWERAKIETANVLEAESLDWVSSKIRHGGSLKAVLDRGKELYGDFSKPVVDLYRHDMEGVQQVVGSQGGTATGDGNFDERTRRAGDAIIDMSETQTNKIVEWRTGGSAAGDPETEPESLKDKTVSFFKKVFDFDEDKLTDLDRWFPPED